MFISWLIFPLASVAVLLGLGLFVDRLCGRPLPGGLLVPVGFAALVVVTQFTMLPAQSFPISVPVVIGLALFGFAAGYRRLLSAGINWLVTSLSLAVFTLSGAVIWLTGEATFAGYGVLGDTSVHMIGADYLVHHGRSFGGNLPSAYARVLIEYFEINAYPSGMHTALGTLAATAGADVAWVYQPFLSLLLAISALSLYSLARAVVGDDRWAVAIALPASVPSLVYGFYLQGSLKEIGFATLLMTLGALSVELCRRGKFSYREALAPAVAAAAGIATIGMAALTWLLPLLAILVIAIVLYKREHLSPAVFLRAALAAAAAAIAVLIFSIPTLTELGSYLGGTKFLVKQAEFGNLTRGAISPLEMFGSWLGDDYRNPPGISYLATNLLVAFAALMAFFALCQLVMRRKWALLAFLLVSAVATAVVVFKGSPWADAKAYMIAAPLMVLLAGIGCFYLSKCVRIWVGAIGLAIVIFGVGVSDVFQAREARLAPYTKLRELSAINGQLKDGQPTYVAGFNEFSKYFLRDAVPDTTNDWSIRGATTTDGSTPQFGRDFPVESLTPKYLDQFSALVLFRGSKPPVTDFKRISTGRYYDVWRKRVQ